MCRHPATQRFLGSQSLKAACPLAPRAWLAASLIVMGLAVALEASNAGAQEETPAGKFRLMTSAFKTGGEIPSKFTCEGADVSPMLTWNGPPAGTQSFVLIVDDPDAPGGTFTHWLVYDLPASLRRLPEGVATTGEVQGGGRQGTNDFPKTGYAGPCPPPGKPHRYFFRLYALDAKVGLHPAATRQELAPAMQGHVLAQSEVMGKFRR